MTYSDMINRLLENNKNSNAYEKLIEFISELRVLDTEVMEDDNEIEVEVLTLDNKLIGRYVFNKEGDFKYES